MSEQKQKPAVVSDLAYGVLKQIQKFYLSLCARRNLTKIEDLGQMGFKDVEAHNAFLSTRQEYATALKCILFSNTLVQATGEDRDRAAGLFWGLYQNLKKEKFTHEEAMENAFISLFTLDFHPDGSITLALNPEIDEAEFEGTADMIDDVPVVDAPTVIQSPLG